ncbi:MULTISPECIES: ParA family protein [unclassified Rhodococcus (in: high G+C Gram-positive bacteria)]|uniref:ParA family protein n=1 Tax=unclassified Rhodococcus (in: high G+C Gram-positive bacteria) TaxID=192944 RepID=UPI0013202126|nr:MULTISPECIES: ParA family protein [unclassified Rhodococcus (in: high G+C Gram-positive bacteria)]QHE74522.1 Chromosome (plasmid) partitioning protein ParA [Rhodococcus sp. WAY2]
MTTTAVVNQKGGSGKTTTVLGLASAASARGIDTLVIDLDPQCNASEALGIDYPVDGQTAADLLAGEFPGGATEVVQASKWDHVSVIPADLDLSDIDAVAGLGVEQRLRVALDSDELRQQFPLILIDCPPSIGKLVSNALIAADNALVATEPSFMASRGVSKILQAIDTIQRYYNPTLTVAGVLIGRVPAQAREAAHRTAEIREALGDLVLPEVVPQRAAVAEAVGDRRPIHEVRPPVLEVTRAFDAALDRVLGGARP